MIQRASARAARTHATSYVTIGVKHGKNMDVYLGNILTAQPNDVPADSLPYHVVAIYPDSVSYLP